jgi:TatD DNase family protein
MLTDAHVHMNEATLSNFVDQVVDSGICQVASISNSVDFSSSAQNIELGKRTKAIVPFVGIHPEFFRNLAHGRSDGKELEQEIDNVRELSNFSSGIGEIGIDPKYGSVEKQGQLFSSMLALCEESQLPVSIHSRDAVKTILEIMSSFQLKGSVLFHWFAGTEQELNVVSDRGYFVSFGPAILTSKRMGRLVEQTRIDLILAETDSPTPYSFTNSSISTPLLIASTIFKIGLIRKLSFAEMNRTLNENVFKYLGTQTSLRVRPK